MTGVPAESEEYAGEALAAFAQRFLGPLQKHPLRETPHWTISTGDSKAPTIQCGDDHDAIAADNAIGGDAMGGAAQLANHTDQALHDEPGLLLGLHCASGVHTNSLVDGFAVAYALRERHPRSSMRSRRRGSRRGGAPTTLRAGRTRSRRRTACSRPTPRAATSVRVRFHEAYARRSLVPTSSSSATGRRSATFHAMAHAPEFARRVTLRAGELLVLNNWRTLRPRRPARPRARARRRHGRARGRVLQGARAAPRAGGARAGRRRRAADARVRRAR